MRIVLRRCRALAACIGLVFPSVGAVAQVVSYADQPGVFVADTGAVSVGQLTNGVVFPWTVGRVTFENPPFEPNEIYQPNGGVASSSNEFPGPSISIGNREDFDIRIAGGTTAFGFSIHEPAYTGSDSPTSGCGGTQCEDSTFRIEIFSGSTSLGFVDYNAPDDLSPDPGGPLGFIGLRSPTAFDHIQVRELGDPNTHLDNEYFGGFLITPVPEPSTIALWVLGGLAVSLAARSQRRPQRAT